MRQLALAATYDRPANAASLAMFFYVLHGGCAARASCLSMRNDHKQTDVQREEQRKDRVPGKERSELTRTDQIHTTTMNATKENTCETLRTKNTSDLPPTTFSHYSHASRKSTNAPLIYRRRKCQTWWLRHARVTHEEIAQMHYS